MHQFVLLASMLSDRSAASLLVIGFAAFAGGLVLMYRHKQEIDAVFADCQDIRIRRFEQRKFMRRTLASTMIAAIGILLFSLYWAYQPRAFIGLMLVILSLLTAVLFIAFLDLMSVSIHTVTHDDQSARKEMVNEYLRQRKKLLERVEKNEDAPKDS